MALVFRNVDVDPDAPVESWPFEAVQTALTRGGLSHWRRLASAIRRDPWGPVARAVEATLALDRPYGTTELMTDVVAQARADAEAGERDEVAGRIRAAIEASGLTRRQFAERIGTSAPRLSTYANGTVVPSSAMLVRIERTAGLARP